MKSIKHLSKEEQCHFIKCDCGEYVDMRNLQEVFEHQHWSSTPKAQWTYSKKLGEPIAYTAGGQKIKLN